MKQLILITIILNFSVFFTMAQTEPHQQLPKQDDDEIQTLFKKPEHKLKIGYFVGAESGYTRFSGKDVFLVGLSAGGILDHFFSAGLEIKGIVNPGNLWYDNLVGSTGAYLYGGYGGLKLEFRVFPAHPVHVNFPVLIGGGELVYSTWTPSQDEHYGNHGTTLDRDAFFVIEPGVMLEINLIKFVRVDAGVSYRYTPDLHLINTSSGLINSFNANFSLKFGKF